MIQLSDDYFIDVSSYSYTVGIPKKQTVVNNKTGESKETIIMTESKYYPTFDRALAGWWETMRKKELSKFDGTLEEAIKVVQSIDEKINNIVSNFKITVDNTKLIEENTDTNQASRKRGRPKKTQD